MLNFTHQTDGVNGQFNGRFAFRAGEDAAELMPATFDALSKGASKAWCDSTLKHEYFHWLAFRHSNVGVDIVGRRFHARKAFAHGEISPVIDYYVARTCYFYYAYICHEDIVDELTKATENLSSDQIRHVVLTSEQVERIAKEDSKAREMISRFGVSRPFLGAASARVLGKIATREYGLQNYFRDEHGRVRLQETSMFGPTRGVINAAFETELQSQSNLISILKALRRAMNTEGRAGPLTKERLAMWVVLKFQTELATVRKIYDELDAVAARLKFDSADSYFKNYCNQMADFVSRHTLNRLDQQSIKLLGANLLNCAQCKDDHSPSSLSENFYQLSASPIVKDFARSEGLDEAFLGFFFCHGN